MDIAIPENCSDRNLDGVRSKSQVNKTLSPNFAYAAARAFVEYTLLNLEIDVFRPLNKHDPTLAAEIDGAFLRIRVHLREGQHHEPVAFRWAAPDILAVVSLDRNEIVWFSAHSNKPLPQKLQQINVAIRETES